MTVLLLSIWECQYKDYIWTQWNRNQWFSEWYNERIYYEPWHYKGIWFHFGCMQKGAVNEERKHLAFKRRNLESTRVLQGKRVTSFVDGAICCRTELVQHRINTGYLNSNGQPPLKLYKTRRKLHLKEILQKDVIEELCSPLPSPLIVVTEKYEFSRFFVWYRRLNHII